MLAAWVALAAAAPEAFAWGDHHIHIRPSGGFGRIVHHRDWPTEIAQIERRLGRRRPDNTWRLRVFIFREIDMTWTDADGRTQRAHQRITEEQLDTLQRAVDLFGRTVRAYSGGTFALEGPCEVIEEPLRRLEGDAGGMSLWVALAQELLARRLEGDQPDSVIVLRPNGGTPAPYWGGSAGGAFHGAGYSDVIVLSDRDVVLEDYAEVLLHEWLHQFDWARSARGGYAGLPDLHGAEELGYQQGEIRRGWMDWYWDFMGTYVTPAIWTGLRMRHDMPGRPRPNYEGGFVHEWLVHGPYENADDRGLHTPFLPETEALPQEGPEWRRVESGDSLDFVPLWERRENTVAYAHVYLRPPQPGHHVVWLGSDDGVRVWVNGVLVHDRHEHRPLVLDQDRFEVFLEPGWNRVLVKVDQGVGGWGLALRVPPEVGRSAVRPQHDIVLRPRPVPIRVPPRRPWREVRHDPFRLLPILSQREIGAILGDPRWRIETGENFLALVAPGAPQPSVPNDQLDPILDFDREGFAWVRGSDVDLLLVRCDLMALLDDQAMDLRRQQLVKPSWELVGWVSQAGRLAFVAVGRLERLPRSPWDLIAVPAGPARLHLEAEGHRRTLRVRNDSRRPIRVRVAGSAPFQVRPGTTRTLNFAVAESTPETLIAVPVEVEGETFHAFARPR